MAENLLPAFPCDAFEASQFREDGGEGKLAVCGEFEGLACEVDDPAQDELASVPAAVPLFGLLDGDGLSDDAVFFRLRDHAVDGPEEVVSETG